MRLPSPAELGAPPHLGTLRPEQERLIEGVLARNKAIDIINAPPGIGKSMIAWYLARLLGARTVILTATKGLQDQYMGDFRWVGMRDIRGMGNYPCHALLDRAN